MSQFLRPVFVRAIPPTHLMRRNARKAFKARVKRLTPPITASSVETLITSVIKTNKSRAFQGDRRYAFGVNANPSATTLTKNSKMKMLRMSNRKGG